MRFELDGRFVLSGEAAAAKDTIDAWFAEANTTILRRPDASGAKPAGAAAQEDWAEVVRWEPRGNDVVLRLVSQGRTRAHDALLRLRKGLLERIGKKHRLGLRDTVIDRYSITFGLDRAVKHEFGIPFAKSLRFDGPSCTLELENVTTEWLEKAYIDRMINLVREKVEHQYYEGKGEMHRVLYASKEREPAWSKDPSEEMLAREWLRQGPTKGKWAFRPPAAAVLRAMERIAVEQILKPAGFEEIMIPHHVPLESWVRTGHAHGVPNEVYYVVEPKTRDLAAWERYRDLIKITRQIPTDELMKNLAAPTAGVCYAQCENVYWTFQGKTIADESLPIRVFDRAAVSNRYESGGRHGIERVDEFHRIEPVYIGTKEQILDVREKLLARYTKVFNEILELEWRIASVTPFYMAHSGLGDIASAEKEAEQDAAKLAMPDTGTLDFEAWLPYRGGRAESEWLEFQNLSVIGTKYSDAFNIKGQKAELWTGCSGIGLERWTVAFLAQKGLDPAGWPQGFREVLPELPKNTKFL